jgi:hypothetical protein
VRPAAVGPSMYKRFLILVLPILPIVLAGCGKGGGY